MRRPYRWCNLLGKKKEFNFGEGIDINHHTLLAQRYLFPRG